MKSLVLLTTAACALSACGGSSGNAAQRQAEARLSAVKSAEAGAPATTGSPDPVDSADSTAVAVSPGSAAAASGQARDPGTVDVCALLSPADADSLAQANMLGAFSASKTDTGDPDNSECEFAFTPAGGAARSVSFLVRAGSFIGEYQADPKVDGLGDEAYDDGTSPAVRVGDLLITAERDALPDAVTLDLLRKMAPNLR